MAVNGTLDRPGPVGRVVREQRQECHRIGINFETGLVLVLETAAQAREVLFDFISPGDTILVKGSRAMAMEIISQEIVRLYGER